VGSWRIATCDEVDRLEDVGLARAIASYECSDTRSKYVFGSRVTTEVFDEKLADAHE